MLSDKLPLIILAPVTFMTLSLRGFECFIQQNFVAASKVNDLQSTVCMQKAQQCPNEKLFTPPPPREIISFKVSILFKLKLIWLPAILRVPLCDFGPALMSFVH